MIRESVYSLSSAERARVRVYSNAKRNIFVFSSHVSPYPNPLPKGEGMFEQEHR
jgi:hypothetical protein